MKKIIFYLLLLLNILLPLCIMSNTIDGDFGWHLRFGQELHSSQPFPYLDTYTYTFYGKPWTNHEWGSDYLIWFVYDHMGYWWLNIFLSLSIFFAFLIIGKTFFKKINSLYLVVALFCQYFIEHIYVPRPTMLTPLFFAFTVYFLEKSKQNYRWLFALPPILWLWSVLHGGWILGFIIINIYFGCHLFTKIIPNKFKKYLNEETLDKKWILAIIATQLIGVILITINPYGLNIFKEIYEYYGQDFYKQHIGEWIPSYAFPIFWGILTAQTTSLVFITYGYIKKKVTFTQLMLFCALFYAAIMYKRQAVFMSLLSAPILAQTFELAGLELAKLTFFKKTFIHKTILIFLTPTLIFLVLSYLNQLHFTTDPWNDRTIIENGTFSFDGLIWLKNNAEPKSKIFSEFSWASLMNWEAKQAYVFFDGRGTATWMYNKNTSMLEYYYNIRDNVDGLSQLESLGTNYIILRQPRFAPFAKPDFINEKLFGSRIEKMVYLHKDQIQKNLENSKNWQLVYTDIRTNIWKRINLAP